MPTPLRRRLRLTRRYATYALAVGLVVVALVVGAASQLLPLAERHPQQIAAWLSERAGQPVHFDSLRTAWTRRGPLLEFQGLRLGGDDGVRIGEAEVLVSMYSGLLPGSSLTELRLRGVELTLQRSDDGLWSVQGLPAAAHGDPLSAMRGLGELQVVGGKLHIDAPSIGLQTTLPRIDLRMRVNGARVQVGARSWIERDKAPLQAVLDFDRRRGDGNAYVQAKPVDLAAWSPLLQFAGVQATAGEGQLQAWATLHEHRIAGITVDADLSGLRFKGARLPGESSVPKAGLAMLKTRLRWKTNDSGWRLDAPLLRMGNGTTSHRLDGLTVAGGRHYAVAGEQLDASPLLPVLALSDQLPARLRSWLYHARPSVKLASLQLAGEQGGPMQASGRLDDLAFAPVGGSPGLRGLQGDFDGDGQALEFRFAPTAEVDFDWPTGFGVVHQLHLAGTVVGWRKGAGWDVGTAALRVDGNEYKADVRGHLFFQGDGTRPWIGLAAKIDNAPITVAKKFWVHSKMSPVAIDWLNNALVGGTLTGGEGLAVGDLDNWPFDGHDGRFEASGHIVDGDIRFQKGWPAMRKVDADVRFIANGFEVKGKSELAGVAVDHFDAGIDDFKTSRLYVRADSRSTGARMLDLLRQSPLQKTYDDTLRALTVTGATTATFDMLLPLKHDVPDADQGHLRGDIGLQNVTLADARWNVQFNKVSGAAHYSNSGFAAENMDVHYGGQAGFLTLRAGSDVVDPAQAFEAEFQSMVDVKELFARAPQMAWLQPYVHGVSRWNVDVALPRTEPGKPSQPTHLTLDSDLLGTTLDLPAPLDKGSGRVLPTHVDVALPLGSGDIDVAFGRLVAVKAASQGTHTGVRVVMGSDRVTARPPTDGLVVSGHTSELDALDWITLARSGGSGEDGAAPLSLRSVDVSADRLLLIGGAFNGTRLRMHPQNDHVLVRLDGPSLAGQIDVPDADNALISGKLSTLHWQPAEPDPAPKGGPLAGTLPEPARRAVAQTNPAAIPSLALDVDDLQFGQMKLGSAVLRTQQMPEGMMVNQLQLRAPKQKIDLTGHWFGTGENARTQLSVNVDSEDLGKLLQNLAFGGQLKGGEGKIQLEAGWNGTPTTFQLADLEGSLKVDARNGQLLEVEPGAGRVLGLLSVAQLPRRLMLDFRDFFSKGLAFNHVDGEVAFGDGLARANAVKIEGPALNMVIRGEADLRNQQFDQTIDVYPKSGNLLTVVGAVAGGPVGAAVGAAANAVLSKPLGEIGARTYHVTGPWKDPKVEVISRDQSSVATKRQASSNRQ